MADGLSDALRQMAEGEHAPPPRRQATRPAAPAAAPAADTARPTSPVHPRPAAPPQSAGGRVLTLSAAALLLAMGLVMGAMGGWATMILAGHDVWRSEQPGARSVAAGLLVTYPIALCLLGAGSLLIRRALKR